MACPKTRAPVVEHEGWLYSTDESTRLRYPIRDGFPVMLIDEAETVSESEFASVMAAAGKVAATGGSQDEASS